MTRTELLDQLDTTLKQLVADKTPPSADDIERASDICSGIEIWMMDQTERLAAMQGKKLWIDEVQAAKATAERSRN